jgi:ADP-ribose pyrophosphatase
VDGSRSERDIADHPGAVAIVAIDPDGAVLLVRQWRTPAARVLLEIPAGTLDVDEATGAVEDPDLAARRELEEETGYRAGTWERLTSFWSAPGFTSELMHLYLATELVAADPDDRLGPDEGEHLRLERRPLADALAAVDRGEIADSKSIVGLLWVERLRTRDANRSRPGTAMVLDSSDATATRRLVPPPEPAPGAIIRTFRMNRTDLVLANAAAMRRSRTAQAFGLLFAAGAILSWLNGDAFSTAYAVAFASAFWSGLFPAPFLLVAVWRYPERMLPDITVSIDERGIDYRSPNASSTTDWDSVQRISESGRFFLISFPPMTYLLPKRFFDADELRTIRRWTAERGFGPDGRRRRAAAGPRPPVG